MSSELLTLFMEFICGLLSEPKVMLGVEGNDTEGEPIDEVMTG